jgi:hypothetical protein
VGFTPGIFSGGGGGSTSVVAENGDLGAVAP